jgi:predicted  nucleic acid-binding Zn-ribbon protein
MNRHLEIMLQLQELELMRKAQAVVQPSGNPEDFKSLDQKINKLRHKLPGDLLSQFDGLLREKPDALAQLSDGVCLGCHQEVSSQLAERIQYARGLARCKHCGRFLFSEQHAPRYLGVK